MVFTNTVTKLWYVLMWWKRWLPSDNSLVCLLLQELKS